MICKKDIERMATLSKLELDPREIPGYIEEMQAMLEFAQGIDADLSGSDVPEPQGIDWSSLRDDTVFASLPVEDILSNSKDTDENFVRLRKRA